MKKTIKAKKSLDIKAEDVFRYHPESGTMFLGEYRMTPNEIKSLQEEIKYLESTKIWEVWQNTIKKQAIDIGLYDSTTFEDIRTAKCFLKVIATLRDINTVIKSWKAPALPQNLPVKPIDD